VRCHHLFTVVTVQSSWDGNCTTILNVNLLTTAITGSIHSGIVEQDMYTFCIQFIMNENNSLYMFRALLAHLQEALYK
jgi:hypothetical protein